SARRQLLRRVAHRPHGGGDRRGHEGDRGLRRRRQGDRGRLAAAQGRRARAPAKAADRLGRAAGRRAQLLRARGRGTRAGRGLPPRSGRCRARPREIRRRARAPRQRRGRAAARAPAGRGREGRREPDALPRGLLPRLRHRGRDGAVPEARVGRVPGADTAMSAALKGKRILLAKPGLDGHDVGAKVVALALRDAGADVIYTGLRKSPAYIAQVAVDEDVDALGLSILSGSHLELVSQTRDELAARGADHMALFVGGTIPASDHEALKALGVRGVFTSDRRLADVVASVARALADETRERAPEGAG